MTQAAADGMHARRRCLEYPYSPLIWKHLVINPAAHVMVLNKVIIMSSRLIARPHLSTHAQNLASTSYSISGTCGKMSLGDIAWPAFPQRRDWPPSLIPSAALHD